MNKYRAWHIKEKAMFEVLSMFWYPDRVKVVCYNDNEELGANYYRVGKEVTLMQSTRHTDKNHQQVWEGDIIHIPGVYGGNFKIVRSSSGEFKVSGYHDHVAWCSAEVIGNIHKSPELLNS